MPAACTLTLALAMLQRSGMARKRLGDGGCSRALLDCLVIRGVIACGDDGAVVPTDRGRLASRTAGGVSGVE